MLPGLLGEEKDGERKEVPSQETVPVVREEMTMPIRQQRGQKRGTATARWRGACS